MIGYNLGAFSSVYSSEAAIATAGLWGDTSGSNTGVPVAIFGTADNAYAGAFVNNSINSPALLAANLSDIGIEAQGGTIGLSAQARTAMA